MLLLGRHGSLAVEVDELPRISAPNSPRSTTLSGYKIIINAHHTICDMLRRQHKKALDEDSLRITWQILVKPHCASYLDQFDLRGA